MLLLLLCLFSAVKLGSVPTVNSTVRNSDYPRMSIRILGALNYVKRGFNCRLFKYWRYCCGLILHMISIKLVYHFTLLTWMKLKQFRRFWGITSYCFEAFWSCYKGYWLFIKFTLNTFCNSTYFWLCLNSFDENFIIFYKYLFNLFKTMVLNELLCKTTTHCPSIS